MEIPSQYLIELGNDFFHFQSTYAAYHPVYFPAFLCKLFREAVQWVVYRYLYP